MKGGRVPILGVVLTVCLTLPFTAAQLDPQNFTCTATNSTTLVYTWVQPDDPTNVVQGYFLKLDRIDGLRVESITLIDIPGRAVETYTVYNLGKYAWYRAKLNSYTTVDQTVMSTDCQTLEDAPDGAPTTVKAEGISYNEIRVDWSALGAVYMNGVLWGYKIKYYAMESSYPTIISVNNQTLTYTINNLQFDTKYVVCVLPFNAIGDGPQSSDVNKTLGLPTAEPTTPPQTYYCYEAIPGVFTIEGWESMPCTVYVGSIGGFLGLTFMFMFVCCCQCCKAEMPGKEEADGPNSEVKRRWRMPLILNTGFGRGRGRGRGLNNNGYESGDGDMSRDGSHSGKGGKGRLTTRDIQLEKRDLDDFDDSDDSDDGNKKTGILKAKGKDYDYYSMCSDISWEDDTPSRHVNFSNYNWDILRSKKYNRHKHLYHYDPREDPNMDPPTVPRPVNSMAPMEESEESGQSDYD